ncbi:MAG: response regulator [Kiritimatiellia bacterium]|jgi:two-component system response regulator MprA|nr:response regulator [Kiritimatiellia bacterium]MDP6631662.1 response regulator [Kiritimatiellia bacterium]MDP6810760.1 response regulator [Kiritimatiellia bacterium]MDP7022635.1 response regulator [Kiritimatiellia bacterium]
MSKILVVDDDQRQADNLASILKQDGYEAETAYLEEAVVDTVVANPPNLVVLDVMAPEDPSVGFTIARKIRSIESISTLPIIMLTSVNQTFPLDFSDKDIDGDWMPIQAFFEKPINPAELLPKIKELLGA